MYWAVDCENMVLTEAILKQGNDWLGWKGQICILSLQSAGAYLLSLFRLLRRHHNDNMLMLSTFAMVCQPSLECQHADIC